MAAPTYTQQTSPYSHIIPRPHTPTPTHTTGREETRPRRGSFLAPACLCGRASSPSSPRPGPPLRRPSVAAQPLRLLQRSSGSGSHEVRRAGSGVPGSAHEPVQGGRGRRALSQGRRERADGPGRHGQGAAGARVPQGAQRRCVPRQGMGRDGSRCLCVCYFARVRTRFGQSVGRSIHEARSHHLRLNPQCPPFPTPCKTPQRASWWSCTWCCTTATRPSGPPSSSPSTSGDWPSGAPCSTPRSSASRAWRSPSATGARARRRRRRRRLTPASSSSGTPWRSTRSTSSPAPPPGPSNTS